MLTSERIMKYPGKKVKSYFFFLCHLFLTKKSKYPGKDSQPGFQINFLPNFLPGWKIVTNVLPNKGLAWHLKFFPTADKKRQK